VDRDLGLFSLLLFVFFRSMVTSVFYTLSLHDALPISFGRHLAQAFDYLAHLTAEDTQDPLLHEFTSLRAALRMEHVTDGPELLQNMQQIQNQFDSLEGGGHFAL